MQHTYSYTLKGRLIKQLIEYRSRKPPVFLCAHSYVCGCVCVHVCDGWGPAEKTLALPYHSTA